LIGAVIVCAIGFGNFLSNAAAGGVLGGGVLVYWIGSICCSSIRSYMSNIKKF